MKYTFLFTIFFINNVKHKKAITLNITGTVTHNLFTTLFSLYFLFSKNVFK